MPMFHDPDRPSDELGKMQPPRASAMIERKVSEESIRTEFCEGPVLDDSHSPPPELQPNASFSALSVEISDRAEFIERLKRGESPTWVPNRKVGLLLLCYRIPLRRTILASNMSLVTHETSIITDSGRHVSCVHALCACFDEMQSAGEQKK